VSNNREGTEEIDRQDIVEGCGGVVTGSGIKNEFNLALTLASTTFIYHLISHNCKISL
jgi:hypothetical protein